MPILVTIDRFNRVAFGQQPISASFRVCHWPADILASYLRSDLLGSAGMKVGWQPAKWLRKKARLGKRGFPIGTVAFYGPDDRRATKVAASVIVEAQGEPAEIRRWFVDKGDARDEWVLGEIAAYFREHGVRSVAMPERIIGCPHEEGVDYPLGSHCPECRYWIGRDRWTGKLDSS
jgi:hypothetical protein